MSHLRHYPDDTDPKRFEDHRDPAAIARVLGTIGVTFQQWLANAPVTSADPGEKVLAAYAPEIQKLKEARGFATCDVISMVPNHPDRVAFRQKFLEEHTHSEDEARFFVDGSGLFTMRANGAVYALSVEKNDLVNLPAGTRHWFDMGPSPRFTAIRFFTDKAGWVAQFTGDDIASKFPRFSAPDDADEPTLIAAPRRNPRS